jgi:hypothetical protein
MAGARRAAAGFDELRASSSVARVGVVSRFGDIFELRKSRDRPACIPGIYTRDLRSRSQVSPPRDTTPPLQLEAAPPLTHN